MAEVEVESLIEREGGGHSVESGVDLCGSRRKVVEVVGEAGVDLFYVAYTGGTACGGGETVVAVKLEIDGVFETLPFGVGEEIAPF